MNFLPSISDIIAHAASKCSESEKDGCILAIRLMIAKVKNISYQEVALFPERILLSISERTELDSMIERHQKNEPVSKIINRKSFWKHDFFVNGDVLDPRPETELIVESAIKLFSHENCLRILDLGTGSGCILLSLLAEFKNATGVGIDLSDKAIKVAKSNCDDFGINDRAEFKCANWNDFSADDCLCSEKYEIIVSNPPYIQSSIIDKLDDSVCRYDPLIALDGGGDGLAAFREIAKISTKILKNNGGMILCEVGFDQAEQVREIFECYGLRHVSTEKDLFGIDRVVIMQQ